MTSAMPLETTSTSPAPPGRGTFLGFDHIHFWVGNAHQAAAFYICRFGFAPYAFRGLETGSRHIMTHVVHLGSIVLAFSSPLEPGNTNMCNHLARHGDSVKDVAFAVDNCRAIYDRAMAAGAVSVTPPETVRDDEGECVVATIMSPSPDCWHTFVQRTDYAAQAFLPGYRRETDPDPLSAVFASSPLEFVDHCVSNQPDGQMEPVVEWYVEKLGFHRFWSVDDSQVHTKYSSLRSVVVADFHERVKMPVNEPAAGIRKSQIQEFIDYNAGPGIQHIALNSPDIITAVSLLRSRGVRFIQVPNAYYDDLRDRLGRSTTEVHEDISALQKLGILVDFDDEGYLMQIFTKPVQDRPTLFFEVIQRQMHSGFGVGNFKSLFEAIEREQLLRGNL
jgi:4-hydroxyphenylpyruvate dioxygenase